MPRVVVQIVFIVSNLFATPKLRGYFSVYTDCLIEKITAEIGYEAVLSDIAFSIKSFENVGFKVKFSGYNDKIINFINTFFNTLDEIKMSSFDTLMINSAVEKAIKLH
jgi:secreted Zn-dependent insulinase-like peptidase